MPYDRKLIDYVPPYYDELVESSELLAAEDAEFARLNASIDETLRQFTVATATWGLREWERICGIKPKPGSTHEERRSRILAKLRGAAPATLANMLSIVNAHTPGRDSRIIELPEPGVVLFEVNANTSLDLTALSADIATYIPAHLVYRVATASHTSAYMAALTQSGISVTVYPYRPEPITQQAQVRHGGSTINAQTTTIYPKGDD